MAITSEKPKSDSAVRSFHVEFPQEAIDDLRRRIEMTRWPEKETVEDASQGVQLKTMQALSRYWANDYDFGRLAGRLNALPQFVTEINGLDIHFIHVKSRHEDALPMIMTHGWPGSVIEFLNVVGPLTDPTAYGGRAEDAFHVVIPSIPGYGFSGKPSTTGWDPVQIARAWVELMKRLGYEQFVAQGGDWGAIIVDQMGLLAPPELLAIHTNMAGALPPELWKIVTSNVLGTGYPRPTDLSVEESKSYDKLDFFFTKGVGYGVEMILRPQTLYGLADSPIALASWMLDHDAQSYDDIAQAFVDDEPVDGLTRDEILDNVTLAWLTNTGVSSARLYWESKVGFFDAKGVTIPVAVSTFAREIYPVPRSWAEQAYPNLVYFNQIEKGNHFAAWQEPQLFAHELWASFRTLR
ncbi:MAG TPA: alpha/beta fold hydrolase [Acidimicrobiales bacterium]|nr:alpha/beta fold hydrolase [Acidimicrobiales bacterium]